MIVSFFCRTGEMHHDMRRGCSHFLLARDSLVVVKIGWLGAVIVDLGGRGARKAQILDPKSNIWGNGMERVESLDGHCDPCDVCFRGCFCTARAPRGHARVRRTANDGEWASTINEHLIFRNGNTKYTCCLSVGIMHLKRSQSHHLNHHQS